MQFTTKISQKGQIVVPKKIRDKLNIKPADILKISIRNNSIVAEPVSSTDSMFGVFEQKKITTKIDVKQIYKKNVLDKHQ